MTPDTPLRLLIVDDDPTYYETFRDATGWSCEFVEEWDAEKIRHLLSTDRFDLLICDLHFGPVDQHRDVIAKIVSLITGREYAAGKEVVARPPLTVPCCVITQDNRRALGEHLLLSGVQGIIRKADINDQNHPEVFLADVLQQIVTETEHFRSGEYAKEVFLTRNERFQAQIDTQVKVFNASLGPVFLWGEPGVGKRFLAIEFCNKAEKSSLYLALDEEQDDEELRQKIKVAYDQGKVLICNGLTNSSLSVRSLMAEALLTRSQPAIFIEEQSPDELYRKRIITEPFHSLFFNRQLRIWPLRERLEDLPHLLHQFLGNPFVCPPQFKHFWRQDVQQVFAEETVVALKKHHWPSNFRGLQREVRNLFLSAGWKKHMIQKGDLSRDVLYPQPDLAQISRLLEEVNDMCRENPNISIVNLEDHLRTNGTTTTVQQLPTRDFDLRAFLKNYHNKYPELFQPRFYHLSNSLNIEIIHDYTINLFVYLNGNVANLVNEFSQQLKPILNIYATDYKVWEEDNPLGNLRQNVLEQRIEGAHIVLLFLCPLSLTEDERILNYILDQTPEEARLIPVVAQSCQYESFHRKLTGLKPLHHDHQYSKVPDPRTRTLKDYENNRDLDQINAYMVNKLRTLLNDLPSSDPLCT